MRKKNSILKAQPLWKVFPIVCDRMSSLESYEPTPSHLMYSNLKEEGCILSHNFSAFHYSHIAMGFV